MNFILSEAFPSGSENESASNAGNPGSIPGSGGRSPGERNGYLLQYSCLENYMDRGAWAIVHWVAKSDTTVLTLSLHCHAKWSKSENKYCMMLNLKLQLMTKTNKKGLQIQRSQLVVTSGETEVGGQHRGGGEKVTVLYEIVWIFWKL